MSITSKMLEELQKTVNEVRFCTENGYSEMAKEYYKEFDYNRKFAERITGKTISLCKWEVIAE